MKKTSSLTIFTIGHSTRPIMEFINLLHTFGIKVVADVRTIPKSRHNPQYNKDVLEVRLKDNGIGYLHMNGLGGLRHPRKDSVNTAWRNDSFRGFADYMQTEEFNNNLEMLIETAKQQPTVVMCAEAVPWHCHRSLIGDALVVRGISVVDLLSQSTRKEHTLTPWSRIEGQKVTYPSEGPE